jgi:predicted dehydrogenase
LSSLKVAIVGFGAVSQKFYLPLLRAHKNFSVKFIADPNLTSPAEVGLNSAQIELKTDYRSIPAESIDAAIVATPNHLHYPIASYWLNQAIPTLVQKPVVLYPEHYHSLRNKQTSKGVMKSGMVKRDFCMSVILKKLFQDQELGAFKYFDVSEGMVFNWPIQSLSFFDPAEAGGGVLIDNGIHTLDLLFWWMQQQGPLPEVADFQYWDDAQGGIEAEAKGYLQFQNGVSGSFHFSRMRPLEQKWQLVFEKGSLNFQHHQLTINTPYHSPTQKWRKPLQRSLREDIKKAFNQQLKAFHKQLINGEQEDDPLISYTVDLVNQFYRNKQSLRASYYHFTA